MLHYIEDDLLEGVDDWGAEEMAELGLLLGKHAAFLSFLDLRPKAA